MNDQSTLLDTPATVTARGRIAVIADIHGESALLKAAIDAIADKASTKLVLLGDLIDRGPDSRGCLRIARSLEAGGEFREVVLLAGNHEQMALWGMSDNRWAYNFLRNGGARTLAEFDNDPQSLMLAMPRQIMARLKGDLPLWHQDGNLLFVHAGLHPFVDPAEFLDGKQARSMRLDSFDEDASPLWIRGPFLSNPLHHGPYKAPNGQDVIVVHGHTRLGTSNSETATWMIQSSAKSWRIPLDATASGFLPLLEIEDGACRLRMITAAEPSPSPLD